jgi:quinol monooxygenase YgiN
MVLAVPRFLRIHPEDIVVFVTFRARAITADVVPELCRRLAQSTQRQQTAGWLGGGCLVSADDRREVLVYESWATRQSWDAWYHSDARDRLNRTLAPQRVTDIRIEVWEEP